MEAVFLVIQLHTAILDSGTPVSQTATVLLMLMMLAIPMIPYALFYMTLRRQESANLVGEFTGPSNQPPKKHFGWLHLHRPVLHH
jgi:hypothetical protein